MQHHQNIEDENKKSYNFDMNPTTEKTDPMLIHMVLDIRLLKSPKLPIIFEIEFLNFLTKF